MLMERRMQSLSASFSPPIRANSVYSSSDRRLKTDIKKISMSIDKYEQFQPKTFKWKYNLTRPCIGLIAQDVLPICGELINISENESLHVEDKATDLEGAQYSLEYNQLAVINCSIIKQLIERIKLIQSYTPLSKFIAKN